MSSNNNNGEAAGFAFVLAGLGLFALLIYAVAAFLALVFTIVALFAWEKPLTLFGETLTPPEARRFVYGGCIGAAVLPAFALFTSVFFGVEFVDWVWPHFFVVGYILGAIAGSDGASGPESIALQSHVPPSSALPSPAAPSSEPAQPQAQPFRFASWDDEEDETP